MSGSPAGRTPQNTTGSFVPTLTPLIEPRTFDEYKLWLDTFISKLPDERKGILAVCASKAQEIDGNGYYGTDLLCIQAIATTLLAVKSLPEITYPLSPSMTVPLNVPKALACIREADGVDKDECIDMWRKGLRTDERWMTLNWKLCSDSQYQGNTVNHIARTLILSGLEGIGNLPADPNWINDLFVKCVNVTAKEYFLILFGLWSSSLKQYVLNTSHFLKTDQVRKEVADAVNGVVADLNFRIDDDLKGFVFIKGFTGQRLAEALFMRKPYMKISDIHYLIAGHPFLKVQMTVKYLQKAFALARDVENINSTTFKGSTKFSQFIAERFELYFSELGHYWNPSGDHFKEYLYTAEGEEEKKSPDYIVFEKHGKSNVVVLFQAKTKMLRQETYFGMSEVSLQKDLRTHAEFVSRSIKYLFNIHTALKTNRKSLNPKNVTISEKVDAADKCCLIGVAPFNSELFTSYEMRKRLLIEIEREAGPAAWQWFNQKYSGSRWWGWHIMGVDQFETFLMLPEKLRGFYKCFYKYLLESEVDYPVLEEKGKLPRDFRSFLILKYGKEVHRNAAPGVIPPLEDIYQKYKTDVDQYFFI